MNCSQPGREVQQRRTARFGNFPDLAFCSSGAERTRNPSLGAYITGPITSVFWHLGESGEGQEWRVEFRTSAATRDKLADRIKELHSWDNPELIGRPIEWCPEEYATWVDRSTGGSAAHQRLQGFSPPRAVSAMTGGPKSSPSHSRHCGEWVHTRSTGIRISEETT
ncbi:divalent-cation tolerance protein CutA [Nocardia gipuzkoensis]